MSSGILQYQSLTCQATSYLHYIDGLMQERRNPIVNTLELRLSCTNPSI